MGGKIMKKLCVILLSVFLNLGFMCPAYAAKEVSFGVVTIMSGAQALWGSNVSRGMNLASEEINAKGGVTVAGEKYLLKPIVFDDEGKPEKSLAGGKKLSSMYRVPLIYASASFSAFPLMGINEKEGFILMSNSQSPPFTEKGNKLVVRHLNSVKRTMKSWVQFILKAFKDRNLKVENTGVMIVNTELGRYWCDEFIKEWEAAGKKVVVKVSYAPDEADYYTQLTAILAKKPDMIVLTALAESSARVIKQARELGYKGLFLGSIVNDPRQLASLTPHELLEGTFLEVGRWEYRDKPVMEFINNFKTRYGEEPLYIAGLTYEAVYIFAKALEIAGTTTDVYKIRAAFPKAYPVPNSLFQIQDLDETGDIYIPVFLVEFKGGRFSVVKD
jgi:branched-chain amino acid transport system substrate-binding protein